MSSMTQDETYNGYANWTCRYCGRTERALRGEAARAKSGN